MAHVKTASVMSRPLAHLTTPSAVPRPNPGYRAAKRMIDVCVASAMLVSAALPMLVIALLVKLEDRSSPVFYRQMRTGLGGRRFALLKFRTMVADADAAKEALRELSVVAWPDFRLHNDPRVTRIGRFLRKTSLDELPQLINVVRGEMSLVGPRPTSFDASTYQRWHTARLDFRPGMTGPWQVWGRSTLDFEERCRLEISFFRQPSLLREFRLLLATVLVVFKRTGAA
jgi:lipopolysaccharide/colanic/teichoic acid biosynthesis glycosyltransferase